MTQSIAATESTAPRRVAWPWIALVGLLVVGAALRLFRLGAESLWFDETYSVAFASADLRLLSPLTPGGFAFTDKNTYHVILHFWLALGRGEYSIRLLSALIGVATLALLYLFGQRLYGVGAGLWAAGLLAMSPYHVWYSREARMYGLAALSALAAAYLLYEAVRSGGLARWCGYVVCAVLALYTHTFAMFMVAAANLWAIVALIVRRQRALPWLAANLAVVAGAAPWLQQIIAQQGQGWWAWIADKYGVPSLSALALAPRELFFGAIRPGPGWVYWVGLAAWLAMLALGLLHVRRADGPWRWRAGSEVWALGAALAVLPILLAFAVAQAQPMFVLRYMVPFLPPMCLLAGRGLSRLRPAWALAPLVTAVTLASALALSGVYAGRHKEDWRAAGAFLDSQARAGEVVFVVDEDALVPIRHYTTTHVEWRPVWRGRTDTSELSAIVDPAIADGSRFWLLVSHSENQALEAYLTARRPVADERTFAGVRLLRFDTVRGGS